MISARQEAANTQNAQRSSGPATEARRIRSSKNAIPHGLTTTGSALLESKMPKPTRVTSKKTAPFFVTQLAEAAWRLRRVRKFENGILNADPTLANDGTLDKVHKLNRYESAIERTYYRAFRELEKLRSTYQRARLAAVDAYIMAPIPRAAAPAPAPQIPTANRTHSQNRPPLDPGLSALLARCQKAVDHGSNTI